MYILAHLLAPTTVFGALLPAAATRAQHERCSTTDRTATTTVDDSATTLLALLVGARHHTVDTHPNLAHWKDQAQCDEFRKLKRSASRPIRSIRTCRSHAHRCRGCLEEEEEEEAAATPTAAAAAAVAVVVATVAEERDLAREKEAELSTPSQAVQPQHCLGTPTHPPSPHPHPHPRSTLPHSDEHGTGGPTLVLFKSTPCPCVCATLNNIAKNGGNFQSVHDLSA
jgi:hypothetical protein